MNAKSKFVIMAVAASLAIGFVMIGPKGIVGQHIKSGSEPALRAPTRGDVIETIQRVRLESPEAKYLIKLRADKAAGRPAHLDLSVDPEIFRRLPIPVPAYKGSVLQIDRDVRRELQEFEERFVAMFLHQDPEPQSRKAHFAWLPLSPALRQIGWGGGITNVEIQPDQSAIVTIKIQPWLFSNSRSSVIFDFVRERYLVANGVISLVDSDAHDSTNHNHRFPIAR